MTAAYSPPGTFLLPFAAAAVLSGAAPVLAHDMWANAFAETDAGGITSVVTTIGWGHSPRPLSEFIAGSRVSGYGVVDPEGAVVALPFDAEANTSLDLLPEVGAVPGLTTLEGGDAFMRRLIFDEGTIDGTWRVYTGVPARVSTTWIDGAGDSFSEPRFADEITGAARIVSSTATMRGATAYWTRGGWSEPVPVADLALELLPAADLSAVQVGDTVSFRVYRDGSPAEGLDGATFAAIEPSGAEVEGTIDADGTASVAVSGPGLWIVRSAHFEDPDAAGPGFAAFAGRVEQIRFIATVTFEVAP